MYEIKETFREDIHTINPVNFRKMMEHNLEDHDDFAEFAENSSLRNPHQYLTAVYNQGSFDDSN